jgi:hypothetical protein
VASVNVANKFNDQVECDLMFHKKFVIFHAICRCTRWEAAWLIDQTIWPHPKEQEPVVDALVECWLRIHGPMRELIMDGESAVAKALLTASTLSRKGINLVGLAPNQHARIIDRRTALTRLVLNKMDTQLEAEGLLDIPFKHRLAEAVFAGNALISVNRTTPYNAVYGRVPHLLPDLPVYAQEPDSPQMPQPGILRNSHRLREIAIQNMVSATAAVRIGTAMGTRSLPTQSNDYKVGDQVEYHRPSGRKDLPGWIGPATVVDVSMAERGNIAVRHQSTILPAVAFRDLRPWEAFLSLLTVVHPCKRTFALIRESIEHTIAGHPVLLGTLAQTRGPGPQQVKANDSYKIVLAALHEFASSFLGIMGCTAFRIGWGSATLPSVPGVTESIIMYWLPDDPERQSFFTNDGSQPINMRGLAGAEFARTRFIQFLTLAEDNSNAIKDEPVVRQDPVNNDDDDDYQDAEEWDTDSFRSANSYLMSSDPDMYEALRSAMHQIWTDTGSERIKDEHPDPMDQHLTRDHYPSPGVGSEVKVVEYYHIACANRRAELPPQHYLTDNLPTHVELVYTAEMARCLPMEQYPGPGEVAVVHLLENHAKKAVIERDTDNLTKEECELHADELASAMLLELQTWQKYSCFSRRPRKGAINIIDCRWVLKWKIEELPDGKTRRVIRARLTVRGFKDRQASEIDTFAGTAARYSQRLVVSEAVNRGWEICTADVSKAFLQGVTYEELSKLTGDPVREVNFYLPYGSVPMLRKVKGFESFDQNTEVLHCDKPGTGLADAPRAFSIKLTGVTSKLGIKPTSVDDQLCVLHKDGKLVGIFAKHVDDLKIIGERNFVEWLVKKLEEVFGPLKQTWNTFTNCGVRHVRDPITKSITCDQYAYIEALKVPVHSDLAGGPDNDLGPQCLTLYQSSLGAVAFCSLTRIDAAVFIVALQRVAHKPQVIHFKRLCALIRYLKRSPQALVYKAFKGRTSHIRLISDAAFRKEDDDAHALKGAVFVRVDADPDDIASGGATKKLSEISCHVIDYYSRKQRHVTRSTFGAELFAACDAADHGILMAQIVQEMLYGVDTYATARQRREHDGWQVPIVLAVDAMSVFAAVTASQLKIPTERSLWSHVQFLRELLDTNVLRWFMWVDTRDMHTDGLTKGSVERTLLHQIMKGVIRTEHEYKSWRPKRPKPVTTDGVEELTNVFGNISLSSKL